MNPINPQTGLPWSDAEMAYFRLIQQQQQAGLYDPASHDRFMTTVARPDAETGAPNFLQGADPYQVRGGIDWARFKSDEAYQKQVIKNAQEQLAFQKGQSVGYVDGKRTLEGVMRDDDIRRNPMNAAIYEQERRGYRPDAGNMPAEQYMTGKVGDETNKTSSTKTAPKTTPKVSETSSTSTRKTSSAPSRVAGSVREARINPNTGQAEFLGDEGWFSVDKGTTSRLGAGNYGQGTRGTGDDSLATGTRQYSGQQASTALQDYNKRVASLTPEAAKAFAAFDASRAVPGRVAGGEVEVPGYDGGGGLQIPEVARLSQQKDSENQALMGLARASDAWVAAGGRKEDFLKSLFQARRFIDTLEDFYRGTNRLVPENIANQLGVGTFDRNPTGYKSLQDELNRYRDISRGNTGVVSGASVGRSAVPVSADYVANQLFQKYRPQMEQSGLWSAPPKGLAGGGQMTIGGAPHWIVDPMGNPVAALTEDGKPETVKGKGGVEVVPTDPQRKRAYLKNRTANRPGAASGDRTKTLSGKTTHGEVKARTTGAKDGRVNNGKTNNGRVPAPGQNRSPDITDSDAASVRKPVQPAMMGMPTVPVQEPSGAVMPYRSMAPGNLMPMFVPGHVYGGSALAQQRARGMAGRRGNSVGWGKLGEAWRAVEKAGSTKQARKQFQDDWGGVSLAGPLSARARAKYGVARGTPSRRPGQSMSEWQSSSPQPVATTQPVANIAPIGPSQRLTNPDGSLANPNIPAMDASGGTRIIGNETAPTARYGFDRGAPIDIAANAFTRGVKGSPGVFVAQPWKHAPRALLQRGQFGNQLLQSYWNATGAAPEDLAERGMVAVPGDATSGRSYF